jgi:hypothetical protein
MTPTQLGPATNGPVPPNFRKFKFRANLENTDTGQLLASEGELVAVNSSLALVKLIATFSDSPLRILVLEFKDTSEQRLVVLTPPCR